MGPDGIARRLAGIAAAASGLLLALAAGAPLTAALLALLAGVLACLGLRAVVHTLRAADARAPAERGRAAWTRGLWGTAVVLPLALAALLDAAPVLSFLR